MSSKTGWGEWPGEVGEKQDYSLFQFMSIWCHVSNPQDRLFTSWKIRSNPFAPHAKAPQTALCMCLRQKRVGKPPRTPYYLEFW